MKRYTTRGYQEWREILFRIIIGIVVFITIFWLAYQFWRLLFGEVSIWSTTPAGAVDLRQRYQETHEWFAGGSFYGTIFEAVYPPASYVLLWPFVGWVDFATARWIWAFLYIISLALLIVLIIRQVGVDTKTDRIFIGLLPLSMYATGATIGNGQFAVLIIPLLIIVVTLLLRQEPALTTDITASLLMVVALVKPTVAAPFLWLVLFLPGRLRPGIFTALLYLLITAIAAAFRDENLATLIQQWLNHSRPSDLAQGVALNAHRLSSATVDPISKYVEGSTSMANIELPSSILGGIDAGYFVTLSMFALLGIWIYRNRSADRWILLGVTGIVARLWTYHRWFDDLLLLLPMIALVRIARQHKPTERDGFIARLLFAMLWLVQLEPGLHFAPISASWIDLYLYAQLCIWLACGLFMAYYVRRERRTGWNVSQEHMDDLVNG